ncbi:MAG TPA: molybdopterin molybdotransferase MoeA, partial [Candidatus Paceibacterota bacterium]|nr:molybdopterin molybdotransferase MoeA [Candidatus Paceibacterota bacterium]
GEDVKEGTAIARIGEKISVGQLALFASLGLTEIPVAKRPRIALLATGSELKEPGETLAPGQIFESNRTALTPLISNAGGLATQFPIVEDDPKITRDALKSAFAENDIVITCGGVSVGELDFVKSAFEELGGTLNFWKVAIKPGKPFVFGRLGSKFLFGLPGNPVSAFVTFLVLVRPALLRWQAAVELSLPVHRGRLAEGISNPGDRRHFMRVRIASDGSIHSAGTQASHILSALAMANALLDVPPKTSLPAGAIASVLRWE